MTDPHIAAAGGIVVRHDPDPRIAIVQLRRSREWVLPKGKLNGKESALAAARREVMEETGHDVSVHEFVGALSYITHGRLKVVQFWRMQASHEPARTLIREVRAVSWLPLEKAVEKLTRPRERVFLENVGPAVLGAANDGTLQRVKSRRKKAARLETAVPVGSRNHFFARVVERIIAPGIARRVRQTRASKAISHKVRRAV